MKKIILTLLVFSSVTLIANGKNLSAFFSFCTFDRPGQSPYIETYLNVEGNSVKLVLNAENKLQGKIEVQWTYKQNDKVVHFDKYNLLGQAISDTTQPIHNFVDLKKVSLINGDYDVELKITDKNRSDKSYVSTQHITVNYQPEKINISDIEFVESFSVSTKAGTFTKSGYDIVPLVFNFFPKTMTSLKFYAEIYYTKEVLGDDDFLITYQISGHQNKNIINNLVSYSKQKTSSVNIIMAELPIEDVNSGNYYLSVEVKDKKNNLLASRKAFFQRINPPVKALRMDDLSVIKIENTFVSYMTDKDTLKNYIASLYPISTQFEANVAENQVKLSNLESMQQFFYYFWSTRNPQDPEQAWLNYYEEVKSVNAEYRCTSRKGYESDRGRVYLQYGRPNSISRSEFDGTTYPYEIWQYYAYKEQSNIKFVFMSRNLSANCYDLIHSTARGEFYDSNWEAQLSSLSKSNSMGGDIDRGDNYSNSSLNGAGKSGTPKDLFNNPK